MAKSRKTKKTGVDIIVKFDSVTEFENYFDGKSKSSDWTGEEVSLSTSEERREFTTTGSFEEAQGLLKYGDRANFEKLVKSGLQATNAAQIGMKKQRQLYTSVTGFAAHVPNYIAGVPTSMIAQRQICLKQRVVNIVFNNSYSFDIEAGKAVESCVDLLNYICQVEASGVRVNLYVASLCQHNHSHDEIVGFVLKVKDSGQYMDLLKTAYPLVNPSFFRRHDFRFMEVTEGVKHTPTYGKVIMDSDTIKKAVGEAGIEGGLIVEGQKLMKSNDRMKYLESVFRPQ